MGQSLFAVILLLAIPAECRLGTKKTYECPPKQEVSCEKLRANAGYKYSVPLNISDFKDCEQAWNLMNGTCIANSDGEKLKGFVKDATFTNVTTISCEELQWDLRCDHIPFYCLINYTVLDPGGKAHESHHDVGHGTVEMPDWSVALIVMLAVIVIASIATAVWFYRRKRGNGLSYIGVNRCGVGVQDL